MRPAETVFDAARFEKNIPDPKLMRELIGYFEEDSGSMLTSIETALEKGDADALHRAAHGLRGLIGNYCAERAFDRVGAIDNRAQRGDLSGVKELMGGLRREVGQLNSALREFREALEQR